MAIFWEIGQLFISSFGHAGSSNESTTSYERFKKLSFNRILSKVSLAFAGFRFHPRLHKSLASSVTRLGDFLHFG